MTRPVIIVAVASMLFVGAVQANEQPADGVNISLPEDVAAFAERLAALHEELEALRPKVSGVAAEQCRLASAGTQNLAQYLHALAAKVDQSLADVAALKALRRRLDKLEARYASLQGRVNTIALAPDYTAGDVPFVLAAESPMRKVFLEADRFSSTPAREYRMAAARNESGISHMLCCYA